MNDRFQIINKMIDGYTSTLKVTDGYYIKQYDMFYIARNVMCQELQINYKTILKTRLPD